YLQIVEVAFSAWLGRGAGLCVFEPTCGRGMALEHNGDLYSCDHYVFPEYRLGNLNEKPLVELVESPFQQQFGRDKREKLPRQCRECEVLFLCNGECPKNRIRRSADGEAGLNYLCAGLKQFFTHIAPTMEWMAQALANHRAPAGIMEALKETTPPPEKHVGRNDPCPCGSGKKYKKCCGARE
ncbi:MAG TPA: SPASM domain-containing protein, partial [Armatimonadota bacterium]|nr:SPASM domain-containing protein [Armatimonadota bacterium]